MIRNTIFGGIILFLTILSALVVSSASVPYTGKHLTMQFRDSSDNIITGTFNVAYNLSTNSACTDLVYNYSTSVTTNKDGIFTINPTSIDINYSQALYECIYYNGTLQVTSTIYPSFQCNVAQNVSMRGVIIDSNWDMSSWNITANNIFGLSNVSDTWKVEDNGFDQYADTVGDALDVACNQSNKYLFRNSSGDWVCKSLFWKYFNFYQATQPGVAYSIPLINNTGDLYRFVPFSLSNLTEFWGIDAPVSSSVIINETGKWSYVNSTDQWCEVDGCKMRGNLTAVAIEADVYNGTGFNFTRLNDINTTLIDSEGEVGLFYSASEGKFQARNSSDLYCSLSGCFISGKTGIQDTYGLVIGSSLAESSNLVEVNNHLRLVAPGSPGQLEGIELLHVADSEAYLRINASGNFIFDYSGGNDDLTLIFSTSTSKANITYMGDEGYFDVAKDFNITSGGNITADGYFFGDGSFLTNVPTFNETAVPYTGANQEVDLGLHNLTSDFLTIGHGVANTNYSITFNGQSSDGSFYWAENLATFVFNNNFQMSGANAIQLRQAGIYSKILSRTNGHIDYEAGTTHDFTVNDVEQLTIGDGVITPTTDSDVDIGTDSKLFKYLYVDNIVASRNITANANISADYYFGNASEMSGVVKLYESNTFTADQIFQGNITADNVTTNHLTMPSGATINWSGYDGCLFWEYSPSSSESSICGSFSALTLNAVTVSFPKSQYITLGSATETQPVGYQVVTAGVGDRIYIDDDLNAWQISYPLAWDAGGDFFDDAGGFIFSTFGDNEKYNWSWNMIELPAGGYGQNHTITLPSLKFNMIDGDAVNSTTDFCLPNDSKCLNSTWTTDGDTTRIDDNVNITGNLTSENDCGIPSATLSFEKSVAATDTAMASGNGDILDGDPMACSGTVTSIAGYCENCNSGVNEIAYELRINGVSQDCDTPQLTSAGDVDSAVCSVNFVKHDTVGCWSKTETGAVTGTRCVLNVRYG